MIQQTLDTLCRAFSSCLSQDLEAVIDASKELKTSPRLQKVLEVSAVTTADVVILDYNRSLRRSVLHTVCHGIVSFIILPHQVFNSKRITCSSGLHNP